MKIKKNNKKYLIPLIILTAGILLLGGWFMYKKYMVGSENTYTETPEIDYSPATDEDKDLNDQMKQDIVSDEGNDAPQTDTGKTKVVPVISAWGQPGGPGTDFKLNGYIPEVIETDGECMLTLTNGSDGTSVNKRALQDAKMTSCGQLSIPFSKIYPGDWKAVLSYSSSTSVGQSVETTIEVK